jgi:RND family efflux transporter MFP subunit
LPASAAADSIEGFAAPYRKIEISAGEPGLIVAIDVQPGDTVTANQLLASLDCSVLEATLEIARQKAASVSGIEAAAVELRLRKEHWEQILSLRERGHATQRELTRAEADFEIAQARLHLAEEEAALNKLEVIRIEKQIATRKIRTPISGIVADVHREPGEAFLISDPRILTVVDLDRLRIKFPATAEQTTEFSAGQSVEVLLAETEERVSGIVERIGAIMDAKSGTIEIDVVLDNPQHLIRSGRRCILEVRNAVAAPLVTQPPLTESSRSRGLFSN